MTDPTPADAVSQAAADVIECCTPPGVPNTAILVPCADLVARAWLARVAADARRAEAVAGLVQATRFHLMATEPGCIGEGAPHLQSRERLRLALAAVAATEGE